MSSKQALSEDQNIMEFPDLYGSPARSETSSVDIYDGLDLSMALPAETTKQPSPSRDCLDLYEEILTEEGTAKEESFHNLNAEYEKCQKQIKQLISKLKEMQCLNSNLQNENQCLKKNISALIKTARVEITRKEEEINRLNQRLYVPEGTRSLRSDPLPLLSFNTRFKEKDISKETANKPSNLRKEEKLQGTSSKDFKSNYSSTKSFSEEAKCIENKSEPNSKPEQRCFKENEGIEKQTSRHKGVTDKKTAKQMENQNREVDRWKKSEGRRSSRNTVTDDAICEGKERSHGQPPKNGKNERSQESRNSSKSDVNYKADTRKHSASSHEKLSSSKENARGQEFHNLKEKHLKTHEKSEHRKESKGHERDKIVEHRHKKSEKDEESKKSKRTHTSSQKSENSLTSSPKQNAGKRTTDSDLRNKHCTEYSDSKNLSKDSKTSKNEVRQSATKNKNCDSKSVPERDSRTEKKRSKEEIGTGSDQDHQGHRKGEKVTSPSSNKAKMQVCPSTEGTKSQNITKGLTEQKEDNVVKDLKLSFMETLHLTLSPAKKKSQDSDVTNTPESTMETDANYNNTEASSKVLESTKDVVSPKPLCKPSNTTDMNYDKNISLEDQASLNDLKSGHYSDPVEDAVALNKEQSTATLKGDETVAETVSDFIQLKEDCPQVVHMSPSGSISDDMDTQSILNDSDLIVLDSYTETEKCSSNEIPSENLNMSMPAEKIQDDEVILVQISEDYQASSLKPNITGATTGICESSKADLCVHDESFVMSLDLNFIRRIPKVVSPLKSPVKPDRTAKASVVSVSYKDPPSNVNISTPNELNKENCEPVSKTDLGSETFPIEISSDEVEEGEIISDDEPDNDQSFQSKCSPNQIEAIKDTNLNKSPVNSESKMASLTKPNGVISPLRKSASETKKTTKPKITKLLALPIDKKNADSCLEGVLNIVPPSNIQDVLQMLRIIRKHIRKKYMKFKIQFPMTQFHRFVEAASLCFTTLANRLNWSKLCSSTDRLKNKLCKLIESKLKQLKKNGIVDRIFEQRLIDMKKRLWKFVEEQLDSLFESLKGMIVKLCDKAKLEHDQEEKRISGLSTKVQKSDHLKNLQVVSKTSKSKISLAKSENDRCLRQLEFLCPRDTPNTKSPTAEDPSVEKKLLKDLSSTCNKTAITPCHTTSPKSNMYASSTAKPDLSSECQKDQHSSAGLSFNLVSDDHMGDIFKSLLSDPKNVELNTLHENMWILDTPEKKCTLTKKYDSIHSLTEFITPANAASPWPSISPPHISTLPRFEPVLTPDVFDESCLLEVPTSTSSSNKSISSSEDKVKSYSVLMEDLAVSLTVPSPLKSDSHLSFLRPVCDPVTVSQVNVNYSEDAVLDEEDASEQDIHLTLDSDNSSTCSLETSAEPEGFQCHPSEPMQAVIMEKSNDHFIVKIRRAVPSSSPVSDSSSLGESYSVATNHMESTHCNIPDECLQHAVHSDTKFKADNEIGFLSESITPISEELDSSKSSADEKCKDCTDLKQHTSSSPKTLHAIKPPLPDTSNQSSRDSSEVELTNVTNAETVQVDCEKLITGKNLKDSYDDDQIKSPVAAKQLVCEMVTPTPCAQTFMEGVLKADSLDLNEKKKKRRSLGEEPSPKRRNIYFLPDVKDKIGGSRHSKTEDKDNLPRKHRKAVSEGNINFTLLKHSPSSGISAKNVIKKKGEVVVSWTRNEDREILLECQQHGPNRKTFLALASKMSKYPHQVEERFRQLMKLFKKSRNSIS